MGLTLLSEAEAKARQPPCRAFVCVKGRCLFVLRHSDPEAVDLANRSTLITMSAGVRLTSVATPTACASAWGGGSGIILYVSAAKP